MYYWGNVQFENGSYFYQSESGKRIFLQDNLKGINELLSKEFDDPVRAKDFVKEGLADLLFNMFLSHDDEIIDANTNTAARGLAPILPNQSTPETPALSKKRAKLLTRKLRGYVRDCNPVVIGNEWQLNVNIRKREGGVESLNIKGTLAPLQIFTAKHTTVAPPGTFPPIVTSG